MGRDCVLSTAWEKVFRAVQERRRLTLFLSVISRLTIGSFFLLSVILFWNSYVKTGSITALLWIVSEGLIILLTLLRRMSTSISPKPVDWFLGFAGTFLVLLVRPTGQGLVQDEVGSVFQLAGTFLSIYGKLSLGRSFGIVPANRGVVTRGPYRLIRHPIYFGYFVTHLGFLVANTSIRNLALYSFAYIFQIWRILAEERVLRIDQGYTDYCRRVRFRLIPRLF